MEFVRQSLERDILAEVPVEVVQNLREVARRGVRRKGRGKVREQNIREHAVDDAAALEFSRGGGNPSEGQKGLEVGLHAFGRVRGGRVRPTPMAVKALGGRAAEVQPKKAPIGKVAVAVPFPAVDPKESAGERGIGFAVVSELALSREGQDKQKRIQSFTLGEVARKGLEFSDFLNVEQIVQREQTRGENETVGVVRPFEIDFFKDFFHDTIIISRRKDLSRKRYFFAGETGKNRRCCAGDRPGAGGLFYAFRVWKYIKYKYLQ